MRKLDKKNVEDVLPLTSMQEGMLYHYLQYPGSEKHIEQLVLEISGNVDIERFRQAWDFVIETNETLRTVFRWEDVKQPTQVILKKHPLQFSYYHLPGKTAEEQNRLLAGIIKKERKEAFDLRDVPFRVTLCRIEEKKYSVIIRNHHILYDGWSNGIILKEFFSVYDKLSLQQIPVKPVKTRARDFIQWLRNQDIGKQEKFWKAYLAGFENKQEPTARRKQKPGEIEKFRSGFSTEIKSRIEYCIKEHQVSLSSILFSAWGILLQKYNSRSDILFDTTVSGRSARVKGIENMVGLFINTLPLRLKTHSDEPIINILKRINDLLQQWEEVETTPRVIIKKYLDDCYQALLFDPVVVIENYPLDITLLKMAGGFSVDSFSNFGMTDYDLTVLITIFNDLEVEFTYNTDLFTKEMISMLNNHFIAALQAVTNHPLEKVSDIHIFTGEEKQEILRYFESRQEKIGEIPAVSRYRAPTDDIEKKLAQICSENLKLDKRNIGMEANFFDFGGHSLKVTLLAARIHKEFAVKVPLAEIFARPILGNLAAYIKEKKKAKDPHFSIAPIEVKEYYPLSSAQRRFYFIQQMAPTSTAYNTTAAVILVGQPDRRRLEHAFKNLIQRHESLRTSFEQVAGELVQRIHPQVEFELNYLETNEKEIEEIAANFARPFDLSRVPLLRAAMIKREQETHILLFDIHHIIADGASREILVKDFAAYYSGRLLTPIPIQYKDAARWQDKLLSSGKLKKHEQYWLKNLSGELPVLNLVTDYPRPSIQSFEGERLRFYLPEELTLNLKALMKQSSTTLYMVFSTVLNILLSKYTGQEEIIIGTPTAGRYHADLENIIGLLIEAIVLRNFPVAEKSFISFLREVRNTTLKAYENQSYPFRELMQHLVPGNDLSRNPLFDVMLNVLHQEDPGLKLEGLECIHHPLLPRVSRVDIMVEVVESGQGITMDLEYCTKLFKKQTIHRFGEFLVNILEEVVKAPGSKIADISFLGETEKQKLLFEFNQAANKYDRNKTVAELFEHQVERAPDRAAVVYEENHLSCKELNLLSHALAHRLREKGVGSGTIVGLMIEPSFDMIVGILGILQAGAAYLPIDAQLPENRITTIIADSGLSFIVTGEAVVRDMAFTRLLNLENSRVIPVLTPPRQQIKDFDFLPIPDRTLIDYRKYHRYSGIALVKHTVAVQGTRGCPYKCLFCHKLWPKKHIVRSAENLFEEVRINYHAGVRKFVFMDDIFNLNKKNSVAFLEQIIKSGMRVQFFYPNGLRGDILTPDYIDLMVEAGTVDMCLSLETGSPRLLELLQKKLNLERLRENLEYIASKHPQVLTQLDMLHGIPTEIEKEALMTLDFVESIKWIHFPNLHVLKIYPNTEMYDLAIKSGISREAIERSTSLAYHELPETLPFSKSFSRQCQTRLWNQYILKKERLLDILPFQMKFVTGDELYQKYRNYVPEEIKDFHGILDFVGISLQELGVELLTDDNYNSDAADYPIRIREVFPGKTGKENSFRILLLDLSQYFVEESEGKLYQVVEDPLGLMYLLTCLNQAFGDRIEGKIAKSRVDFSNYRELRQLIEDFKPELIGIRTLSYFKEFFHRSVSLMREWGVQVPIITGGPYATSEYQVILNDYNVDLVVMGEGELTLTRLVEEMMANGKKLPDDAVLETINGIAFVKAGDKQRLKQLNRHITWLDHIGRTPGTANSAAENLNSINKSSDLAYIIYTSGSTGQPKGVMIEHGNLVGYLNAFMQEFEITNRDIIVQQASYSFDVFVEEIYPLLLKGGKIVIPDVTRRKDAKQFSDLIVKNCATIINCSPLLLNELNRLNIFKSIRIFISGGDILKGEHVNNFLETGKVYNTYGPTETTVCASYYRYMGDRDGGSRVPIGKPISNYNVYILDRNGSLLPVGVPGELCISGDGVARGYLNNPELTNSKFQIPNYKQIPNPKLQITNSHASMQFHSPSQYPITPIPHYPIYMTGDLGRWLSDGNIEFLGRIDRQVKVRGYRIELGEIESRLLNHKAIRETAAVVKENKFGEKYICAYFTSDNERTVKELRELLARDIPDYMIPSYFVQLRKMPLTVTGKVDIQALPLPSGNIPGMQEPYLGPRNEIEKKLVEIWQDILGIERVGIEDNFFELGGDSLAANRVIASLRKELNVEVPLRLFFEEPFIKNLVKEVEGRKREILTIKKAPKGKMIPLSFAQERLWFLQKLDKNSIAYFVPRAINITGKLEVNLLERTFTEIIRRHEILRTVFPTKEGKPLQHILPPSPFKIPVIDLTGLGAEAQAQKISQWKRVEGQTNFNFETGPMIRVTLLKLKENRHLLMLTQHHLVHDGWTQGVLLKEFITIFTAYYRGKPSPLPELPIQYADYACWQRDYMQGEVLEYNLNYWREKLAGLPPILDLPTDRPRLPVSKSKGSVKECTIPAQLMTRLRAFSKEHGVTLFMAMLTVFKVLLFRYTGVEDLCVGTVTANRRIKEMESMLGMVLNTLALRTQISANLTFRECLYRVKQTSVEAFEHEDTPFDKVVDALKIERNLSCNPIFQVSFDFMDTPAQGLRLPDLELSLESTHNRSSKFDLAVTVVPLADQAQNQQEERAALAEWEYNTDIFDSRTIDRLLNHYNYLLKETIENPDIEISELAIGERENLVNPLIKDSMQVSFNF